MRVLYVDVYLLINVSVDLLAWYFSVRLLHAASSAARLIVSALIGAAYAVGAVFLPPAWNFLYFPTALICLACMSLVAAKRVSLLRRFRLCVVFVLFQMLLAGCVYYGYQAMDKFVKNSIMNSNFEAENRKLLVFAVLVLLSVGVLRLFKVLLGEVRCERACRVRVELFGHTATVDALVDSGNLVRDPMDGRAVILVKEEVLRALHLSPQRLMYADLAGQGVGCRLRLIPCDMGGRRCLLYGIRVDGIFLEANNKEQQISALIAWDKEDGTYGGYTALVPSAVLEG